MLLRLFCRLFWQPWAAGVESFPGECIFQQFMMDGVVDSVKARTSFGFCPFFQHSIFALRSQTSTWIDDARFSLEFQSQNRRKTINARRAGNFDPKLSILFLAGKSRLLLLRISAPRFFPSSSAPSCSLEFMIIPWGKRLRTFETLSEAPPSVERNTLDLVLWLDRRLVSSPNTFLLERESGKYPPLPVILTALKLGRNSKAAARKPGSVGRFSNGDWASREPLGKLLWEVSRIAFLHLLHTYIHVRLKAHKYTRNS